MEKNFRRALQTDCEHILASFQATSSVRYEEFTALWRQMNFSSIFHGREEPGERRVFARLALSVAYPFLFPPYTFQIRVGGLYLLYGLFNTQLPTPKEKIRLALKDWNDLMRFRQDAVNAQHYDVVYILTKLLSEKAFIFTAMPNLLYFNVKRNSKKQELSETFVDWPSRPQELISMDGLEELANVHEHYEKLKKAVFAQPVKPELSLVKQNLAPELHNAVLTYYKWQQNQADSDSKCVLSDRGAGEGTSSQDESSRRARLLESIKSRSYAQAVEASKSRRHRQVEVSSAATDTEPPRKVLRYRKKTLSLKERTQLSFVNKVGNQDNEMMGLTRLWHLTAVEDEETAETKKKRFCWNSDKEGDKS